MIASCVRPCLRVCVCVLGGGGCGRKVLMGMGEPLANYDNVLAACRRIQAELGIGARHITISTVGLAPRIRQLAQEPHQFTLAVSLHEVLDWTGLDWT